MNVIKFYHPFSKGAGNYLGHHSDTESAFLNKWLSMLGILLVTAEEDHWTFYQNKQIKINKID